MVANQRKSSFVIEVEQALKNYQDTEWLGIHSPLASPYFLGTELPATAVAPSLRGKYLQELLAETVSNLHGRYADRYQTIIREYYFNKQTVKAVCDRINLGNNSFHLNRHEAIADLAELLVRRMNPALRLEAPPQHGRLWERENLLQDIHSMIQKRQSISLLGSSGLGKSVLASAIAQTSGRPCFWYTIRRGLNDQLETLLFALGYFLHRCGSSTLWLELVAESNQLKPERLLAVARYALEEAEPRPLVCIDDADLLVPAEEANHVPVVRLLESLRGVAPLLLIGQQPILETDTFHTLNGLSQRGIEQLLQTAGHPCTHDIIEQLYDYTQGNPRLLELCLMLLERGESVEQLLVTLAVQPSVEFLLHRVLERLNDPERAIMMEMAIFRRPAPPEFWITAGAENALAELARLRLLQKDHQGGIALLPAYRILLKRRIPEAKQRDLHMIVAQRRERFGDYTAAAYHYVAAKEEEWAIQLWYAHRYSQINQGQAQTALAIFRAIATETLTPQCQEVLTLIRAELHHLGGEDQLSAADIDTILWQTPLLSVEAKQLRGRIANDLSDFSTAESEFRKALEIGEAIVAERLCNLHCVMGWRHLRERKIDAAFEAAQRARYELEQFEGEIQREIANYGQAESNFCTALEIAQQLDAPASIAKTATSLAVLYLFQGETAQAKTYLELAAENYEKLGKVVPLASLQINWALAHNLAGDFHQALAAAQLARLRLARFGSIPPRQEALILQAMAEAHLGLGNLNEAAMYVQQVVDLEEMDVLTDAYCIFGQIQARRQQWDEAVELVQLAIRMAANNQDSYYIGYGWRTLGQIYQDAGRIQEAQSAFGHALSHFHDINLANECKRIQEIIDALDGKA